MPAQLTTIVVKPPRWTFAGYCLWCADRYCRSDRCINLHVASVWMVCPDCNGTMTMAEFTHCDGCFGGVIEAAKPEALDNGAIICDPPAGYELCPFCDSDTDPGLCVCAGTGVLIDSRATRVPAGAAA